MEKPDATYTDVEQPLLTSDKELVPLISGMNFLQLRNCTYNAFEFLDLVSYL